MQADRVVPEVLTLILHPKGRVPVPDHHERSSRLGWSALGGRWKTVPLWMQSAADLLAANDVGLIPWVPLTQFGEPPEDLLAECRRRIERDARLEEQENLLAVTQVFAQLRFPDPQLLAILGGKKAMIKSPLIDELMAERQQDTILRFLQARFGTVPQAAISALRKVTKKRQLDQLTDEAAVCPTLESFRSKLEV